MKHSKVKQHIIETATNLFYKNGYNSTGINEIISEARIAKATLYNHFKSKEDICLAYLQYKSRTFLHDIGNFTKSRNKGKEQVLALFDFLQSFYQEKDFNGCWCIKTVAEIPKDDVNVRAEIQKQKKDFLELISKLIKENLEEISEEQSKSLARRVYLLYEGAVSESHLHQEDWPIKESKVICSDMIA